MKVAYFDSRQRPYSDGLNWTDLVRAAVSTLVVLSACSPSTPRAVVAIADAPDASHDAIDASFRAPPSDSVVAIVERWNGAHDRHDANALAALYASTVDFYGVDLSNAECVNRKRTALAAAPEYRQAVSDVALAPTDGNGGTFVRFTKTVATKGVKKSFEGYLYVIDSRIVAEGDRITDAMGTRYTYCYEPGSSAGPTPNDVRPGEAKVSGLEALLAVRYSKTFAALPNHPSLDLRDCAHGCAPGDFGTCKADAWVPFFVVALDGAGHQVASFTIDPVTKTIASKVSRP